MSYFNLWSYPYDNSKVTVAVAESVTAGALSNALCFEPGASNYFNGGIVAYSIPSKKDILGVDIQYAEKNNFANPFTTSEMAKSVVKMLKSRIGLSTTGYSLPFHREATEHECEINVMTPYAYICLYDDLTKYEVIQKIEYVKYDPKDTQAIQKASAQAFFSLEALKMYKEYVNGL